MEELTRILPEVPSWTSIPADVPRTSLPLHPPSSKNELRARNRVAAKKWRDKKDETLYNLEARNDQLRLEALRLRGTLNALQTENRVLEEELTFFQSFMTRIMSITPKKGPTRIFAPFRGST
jgi:hypothetical protein